MPEKELRARRTSRGSRSRGSLEKERGGPNRRSSSAPDRAGTGTARRDAQGIKTIHHFEKVNGVAKPSRTSRGVNPDCKPQTDKNMVPIKMLIEEEMLIEAKPKHTSPGVIARLMGLDALPTTCPSHKNKKQSETYCHETSHGGFREQGFSYEDQSLSLKGQHEFKDVFEVLEASKINKHQTSPVQMGMRNPNQNESDTDFIRQKFLEAKCFNDERHHGSKGSNDALNVLDSNKDILFKFLHENTFATKCLENQSSVSLKQQSCNITLLKPSRCNNLENCIANSASDREAESHSQMGLDSVRSLRKYGSDLFNGSVKEKTFIGSHKFASSNEGKKGQCSLPTRIVVLKPTVDTVQLSDSGLLPNCTDRSLFACKKQKQYRSPCTNQLFSDRRDQQRVQRDVVLSYLQTYKGASKSLRCAIKHDSDDVLESECNQSAKHGCQRKMQEKSTKQDSGALRKDTSESSDDWDRYHISSSPHSAESSLNGEARIRLSERWRVSSRFRKDELAVEAANTLGGMLALSDKEIHCKPCKNNLHPRLDCPSGISSRDGWKDGRSRQLARSKSLPSSSTFNGISRRKKRAGSFGDEDSLIHKDVLNSSPSETPEVNIVYQEETSSERAVKSYNNASLPFESVIREENPVPIIEKYVKPVEQQTENSHEISEPSGIRHYDATCVVDDITVSGLVGVEMPHQDPPVRDATSNNQIMISMEASAQQPEVNVVSTPIDPVPLLHISSNSNIGDGAMPLISKDADHPSPISVLEPIDDEEKVSPECFEKLNTDLQGLRLQLQLLRLESNLADAVGSEMSSDESTRGDDVILSQTTEDENQRNFSYLRDMLTSVGLHDTAINMDLSVTYVPEYPVDPDVFEKLEKVYNEPLATWTKADRMLLFDFTNSVLTEVTGLHIDLQPWVNPTGKLKSIHSQKVTVDEVWLFLAQHQNKLKNNCTELVLDSSWLDLRDLIDLVGMEIEQMLMGDLLDAIVSEL